jgi:hypothetical protein
MGSLPAAVYSATEQSLPLLPLVGSDFPPVTVIFISSAIERGPQISL